jgi:hypothetical protein
MFPEKGQNKEQLAQYWKAEAMGAQFEMLAWRTKMLKFWEKNERLLLHCG